MWRLIPSMRLTKRGGGGGLSCIGELQFRDESMVRSPLGSGIGSSTSRPNRVGYQV